MDRFRSPNIWTLTLYFSFVQRYMQYTSTHYSHTLIHFPQWPRQPISLSGNENAAENRKRRGRRGEGKRGSPRDLHHSSTATCSLCGLRSFSFSLLHIKRLLVCLLGPHLLLTFSLSPSTIRCWTLYFCFIKEIPCILVLLKVLSSLLSNGILTMKTKEQFPT